MAWPYDLGGYQSPLQSAIGLGGFGSADVFAGNGASGAQNLASTFSATGANGVSGAGTGAGGGLFSGLGDLLGGAFSKNSLFGGTDEKGVTTRGWAPIALGAGQAILGGIQGMQAQKLAQNQFKESKRQFDLNYGAQRDSMNTNLEDRQRARVAANPGAYQSVSEYMDKNRIK